MKNIFKFKVKKVQRIKNSTIHKREIKQNPKF